MGEFRKRTADTEDLFSSLRVFSGAGTRLPTGTHTPSTRSSPIFYHKEIGRGEFGVVTYVWNVTTREKYVVKEPTEERLTALELKSWKEEARIMGRISHDHIVAFLGAEFSPRPRLRFEFVPGGSLDKQANISTSESKQIACQLASGLAYLHEQDPRIAHRDIKPQNILIESRGPGSIFVKFADFGLSAAKKILTTCCGTLLWAAPEIYLEISDPKAAADEVYGVGVDVWSLGLVIAWLECGLPDYEKGWGNEKTAWIGAVLSHVRYYEETYREQGSDLLYFLLDTMLVEDPDERSSASYCHEAALELSLSSFDSRVSFLHRIAGDDGSRTPRASTRLGPLDLAVEVDSKACTDDSEASTIRLESRPSDSLDSSASGRRLGSSIGSDLIAELGYRGSTLIDSLVNSTGTIDSEERDRELQELSGSAPAPDARSGESMVNGLLWKAADGEADEALTSHQQPAEEHGISFLVRYHLQGQEPTGDEVRETVETPGIEAELCQSGRKRTWPEDASPWLSLDSLFRSFTHPLSSLTAKRRGGDEGKGPPGQKRSKVDMPIIKDSKSGKKSKS